MMPVTYYPPATQTVYRVRDRERIAGKPYAHHFRGDNMMIREEVMPALQAPMPAEAALGTTAADLNSLLDAGHHDHENGYCALPDGTAYVASRTLFPGCTAEMFRWWFWWHSFESERYTLWYPWNHVSVRRRDLEARTRQGLTHEQRYIGSTHIITEYIGPQRADIEIAFVDPADWGFQTSRFADAGIHGHACGQVAWRRPHASVGTMVHLIRDTDDGFELRSRYWIGDRIGLSLGSHELPLGWAASATRLKKLLAGERLAYEQLLHDQIEFTHLATFLARIYAEFKDVP